MKFFLTVVCVALLNVSSAQILEDSRLHHLVVRGIDYTLKQEYDSAQSVFGVIIKEYPNHPSGYIFLAGCLEARYTDYGDHFDEKKYDSLLTVGDRYAEKLGAQKPTSAWGNYYKGVVAAYRSYTLSENGNYPSGMYYGISAANSLQRCLEIDTAFTAAKNILGSYYYWRSAISWLPFVSDRSEEGIRLIKQTLQHPYEKHIASHNLMLILTDKKRYKEAEYYGLEVLKEYPENRLYLWSLMTVYEQWGNEKKLRAIVTRLLNSVLNSPVVNYYAEATCRIKLAHFNLADRDTTRAVTECQKIVALKPFIGKTKLNLKKKILLAEEMLKEITGK
ncbi:MAG: hypothetical protein PHP42_14090 [Bacteroidota bacterium]|nr:hypothetical protein [Bacteroidota bacterium]